MKKNFIRVFALVLSLVFVFSFAACGGKGNDGDKGNADDGAGVGVNASSDEAWYLGGGSLKKFDAEEFFKDKEDTVDPAKLYAAAGLTEELIHGVYTVNDLEKDVKKYRKDGAFEDVTFHNGTFSISSVPVAVSFGAEYADCSVNKYKYGEFGEMTEYEVAVLQFATADDIGMVVCTYELDGNSIVFKQIISTSNADEPLTYEFTGVEFRFGFKLAGPHITLTKGESSVILTAYSFTENTDDSLWVTGYSTFNSPLIDELDYFSHQEDSPINYAVRRDGSYYDVSGLKLDGDGRATIYLCEDSVDGEPVEYCSQYAYLVQSDGSAFLTNFSIVFFDEEKTYAYTDDITQREARILKDMGADLSGLTEDEIKEIAEKKADLFDDLYKEFEAQGISVTIDRSTGEIAMDASVLFGGDSAEVTDAGKELLDKFLGVYTTIISNEKYEGFISKTVVEGHTAPVAGSTYEGDLPLSEERAKNVIAYCVTTDVVSGNSALADSFEAVGLSLSKPVYGSDGEIDMDACRRVSFRFLVNIG